MSTVKDILGQFYLSYRETNTPSYQQARAAFHIINCKTEALGGHVQRCDECEHTTVRYNSCRDRHCPMCQAVTNALWVDQRKKTW